MALRNAFGDLASEESLKKVKDVLTSGSQKTINVPTSSGGLKVYRNLSLTSRGANIKSSTGQIYGWYFFNHSSSVRYVKLYDNARTPAVGRDRPFMTIPLPARGGANVNFTSGITLSKGLGIAVTTGVADSDTGSPSANEVVVNIIYF